MIRIVQWNARSIRRKSFNLELLITNLEPEIILINESWGRPEEEYSLNHLDFTEFRQDRPIPSHNNAHHGGVIIYVKNSISVSKTFAFTTPDTEWLAIQIANKNGSKLIICTGYRSPDVELDLSFLSDLFDSDVPSIFAGDLNCWHPVLCSGPDRNTAGIELLDWLSSSGSRILSDGSPTHFNYVEKSNRVIGRQLDIWLANNSAVDLVGNHKSSCNLFYGSDHLVTFFNLMRRGD